MVSLELSIINKNNEELIKNMDKDEVTVSYRGNFNNGDKIVLKSSEKDIFLVIRLDDSMESSFIYLKDYTYEFEIPFDENRKPYGLKAFTEVRHFAYARIARKFEIESYKNLSKNTFDLKNNNSIFPHAETNVLTDDPVFYARNTIDGIFETCNHGSFPHSSWGINKQKDAFLKIDFGRNVLIDEIDLYLRADFPHDNWWKDADIVFSDESREHIIINKTGRRQIFKIRKRNVSWIMLCNLEMSDEPSEFPALSQMEVYGTEADIEY